MGKILLVSGTSAASEKEMYSKMKDFKAEFRKIGIVPVVVLDDAKDAAPLAKALVEGGLPCAEVTFRTAAAADVIKNMVEEFPEILVGAGTVLTTEQVDRAVECGAKFIVSPGLNPEVVKYCLDKGIPVTPGARRRPQDDQGCRSSLCKPELHAHRRHQRQQRKRLSCI